jgi:tRNA (guanine37-N1)-methyltransferase
MRFDVITLFPELVEQVVNHGVTGRASQNGLIELHCWNPRDFTQDVHRNVDDRPYGGGPGMVMTYQPLADALKAAKAADDHPAKVVYLSPKGLPLNQQVVNEFVKQPRLILIAGRYEGIDERFIELHVDEEWSVGDYVLSGGELPAMTVIDAMVRQIPGVLGHEDSAAQDSFMNGLLDCPHYTRPEEVNNLKVPAVLLSGDHAKIEKWRHEQSLLVTRQRRPDLINSDSDK